VGTELELKLAIPAVDMAWVALHPLVIARSTGPWTTRRMVARYFDTPDRQLAQAGIALRLRQENGRWVQTVKTSSGTALALSRRGEWETPVRGPAFDWDHLATTPLRDLPGWSGLAAQLREQFVTRFTRRSVCLQLSPDTRAELSLDRGEVRCGRGDAARCEAICELELELTAGDPRELWRLTSALAEVITLMPLGVSKAERGHALAQGTRPQPCKARPVPLATGTPLARALADTLTSPLEALIHNLRHATSDEPEFVHQARVALRRIRATLGAAAPWVPGGRAARQVRRVAAGLRRLGRQLGAARDLDVLLDETLPALAGREGPTAESALGVVRARALAARAAAYAELISAQAAPACGALLLHLEQLLFELAQPEARVDVPLEADDALLHLLRQQHRRVFRVAGDLMHLNARQRHRLRIAVKRLRYLWDLVPQIPGQEDRAGYSDALGAVQAALGSIHDAAVARQLLQSLQATGRLVAAARRREARTLRHGLPDVAHALARLKLAGGPWRRHLARPTC